MNYVCETVMQKLISHKKPFKFVVTCMITQRTGAGVHSATSACYDTVRLASWSSGPVRIRVEALSRYSHLALLFLGKTVILGFRSLDRRL